MSRQRDRFTLSRQPDALYLGGAIDESAQLPDLADYAVAGAVALDLAAVTFINSIGVREWIRMMAAATRAHLRIELRRVSDILVHQLNIVPATRGTAIVSSFFAPYVCPSCDHEDRSLVDVRLHAADLAAGRVPSPPCADCGAAMELAHPPEAYLSFLQGRF